MQQPARPRNTSELPASLLARLNMYALAASAAGVGMLALAQPSEAKIVYTKTHHEIGTNGVYYLDLNHDGIIDFLLLESGYPFNGTRATYSLLVKEALGNAVEGSIGTGSRHYAAALKRGKPIGRGAQFIKGGTNGETMVRTWADDGTSGLIGKWVNVTNRYLGLKFKIDGKTHYGWARLTVQVPGNLTINATLTGYAYETVPGKSIQAGQTTGKAGDAPAGLGRLALGAAGVAHRR